MAINKNSTALKAEKMTSKTLLSKSDNKVPASKRKSLKTNDKGLKQGVTPSSHLLSVNPFIMLVSSYGLLRDHVRGLNGVESMYASRGGDGRSLTFSYDLFMIMCYIACVGRVGISVNKLCLLIYNNRSAGMLRGMQYKVSTLVNMLLCIRVGGKVVLSVHAEKLFIESVGRDQFRSMNRLAKLLSE